MFRKAGIAALVSAAALTLSAATQAATVEIKFFPGDPLVNPVSIGGDLYTSSPITFSGGGVTISAQGQASADGGATWYSTYMRTYSDRGLAILNGKTDDTHQIDGNGLDERVLLSFSQPVELQSAKFTYITNDDQFSFWTFDPETLVGNNIDVPNLNQNNLSVNSYTFAVPLLGDKFAFGALGGDDDFKLYSVTFETEVPAPGTLGLLGLGLVGLGLVRRRATG